MPRIFKLNVFDAEDSTFTVYDLSKYLPDQRKVVNVTSIFADPFRAGHYWLATVEGLFLFDTKQKRYVDVLFYEGWDPVRFYFDGEQSLWVSLTSKGGLLKDQFKQAAGEVLLRTGYKFCCQQPLVDD